jgi:hypothetical protein
MVWDKANKIKASSAIEINPTNNILVGLLLILKLL